MSHYIPGNPPEDPAALRQWLQEELYRIADAVDHKKWLHSYEKITASKVIGEVPYVFANASAAAITCTLPDPHGELILNVKKTDSSANAVTLSSASLIDGGTAAAITLQYDSLTVFWDETTWNVV